MAWQYSDPREWVKDMRANMERDDDNLVLFTGEPGSGKSTVQFQILRAVDPTFTAKRVAFTIKDFLRLSRTTPKGLAIAADEALASGRKAMYGDNIALTDRLQVCRGKNHTMGLCFPYESRLDSAILEDRVRFKVDIPEKGRYYYIVYERQALKTRQKGGAMKVRVAWIERGKFDFEENRGQLWQEYRDAKDAHMDAQGAEDDEPPTPLGPAASGGDWEGMRDFLLRARENADRPAPGSPI